MEYLLPSLLFAIRRTNLIKHTWGLNMQVVNLVEHTLYCLRLYVCGCVCVRSGAHKHFMIEEALLLTSNLSSSCRGIRT